MQFKISNDEEYFGGEKGRFNLCDETPTTCIYIITWQY